MGIVSKQASNATFFSYLGVVIGFVNVALLMNRWFEPEEFGLRSILLDAAVIYSQVAHLGTYRSLVKFFPFFNREGKSDNGLLSIGLLVSLLGFLLVGLALLIFKDQVINFYIEKSALLVDYFWIIFPLSFLLLYNNVFESYLQSRAKTAYAVFLKSIFNRLITSLLLFLVYLKHLDFHGFLICFVFSYVLSILLFIQYLSKRKELEFSINKKLFSGKLKKVYANYSLFSILSGVSSVLVNKIDALMIGAMIGLSSTAVYANAVYLSILINIPADAIGKISFPLMAKSWKEKKMDEIQILYQKTSLTQFLIGGSIFVLMWSSLDNFFTLQREIYATGKWVFLLLSGARMVNMIFGVNGQIINVSKFFRFDTTTSLLLAVLTILTNLYCIPIWGIEGAAFATALSIVLFNLVRFFYVYAKLKVQPFTKETLAVLIILFIAFLIGEYLPYWHSFYLDTIYRSIVITLSIALPVYYFKLSDDINEYVDRTLGRFGIRLQ